ncbi:MAG: GTPase domain-containing protein [Labilithrix sp.]
MDTSISRIAYVGCGLGGKLTSVISMLTRAQQPIPAPETRLLTEQNDFALPRSNGDVVHLQLAIASRRGMDDGYDPTRADCHPSIAWEIDRAAEADGLVFVIDCRIGRESANLYHREKLRRDLASRGVDIDRKPIVFQANKRDLAEVVPMSWISENFRVPRCTYVESVATSHVGTLEAMRELLRLIGRIS